MAMQTVSTSINWVFAKLIGTSNDRELKRLNRIVDRVNELEDDARALSGEDLRATAAIYRARLTEMLGCDPAVLPAEQSRKGGDLDAALGDILPDVFARVREASRRTTGLRHFDVQIAGGAALHLGRIAEMGTGEGKTLAATLAVSLNAIAGRGVHVVTVNDYLARRDAESMGRIYRALGLSTGVIQHDMSDDGRRQAYAADITYGTNNEFGFDYLRDHMKYEAASLVQRPSALAHHFAIVDEVDSILIDEARTPLIISGAGEDATERYAIANSVVPHLRLAVHFEVDEKQHSAVLTEAGIEHAEALLGAGNLYDPENAELLHCLSQALKAHTLYHRDKEYVVRDGEVVIVDEFTGRAMTGRRWSDGLHQAIETKEGVKVESESQTLATITLQNYFRMYGKLAGMTGTAETEAAEFQKIYDLDVVAIPPNREAIRTDQPDLIYRSAAEKWAAIADDIKRLHDTGRPVLAGTASVEDSETLSSLLERSGIRHAVLNAKHHEREAEIIAQAGRLGAVTIATNMAGRGTDILLGGNPEFLARQMLRDREIDPSTLAEDDPVWIEELAHARGLASRERERVINLGGLTIIGTQRHESRRIDNQLRGRAGRQGDPGDSRFFLSLDDDLMRIFGGERMKSVMHRLKMPNGAPIESRLVSRQIEGAQRAVEGRNFDVRKRTVEYDDVMNRQRAAVYGLRRSLVEEPDHHAGMRQLIAQAAETAAERNLGGPDSDPDTWDWDQLARDLNTMFGLELGEHGEAGVAASRDANTYDEVVTAVCESALDAYEAKERELGAAVMRILERHLWLQVIDQQWKDHLLAIDHLRHGIGLVTMAQKDPLIEFKRVSYELFLGMMDRIETSVVQLLFHVEVQRPMPPEPEQPTLDVEAALERRLLRKQRKQGAFASATRSDDPVASLVKRRVRTKIPRNAPCPCGSGKKHKKCCADTATRPV